MTPNITTLAQFEEMKRQSLVANTVKPAAQTVEPASQPEPAKPVVLQPAVEPAVESAPQPSVVTTAAPKAFASPQEGALWTASRGVPQLRLKPRDKAPLETGWPERLTTDPALIRSWHGNFGSAAKGELGHFWFFEVDSSDVLRRIELETGHKLCPTDTQSVRSSPGRGHFYWQQTPESIAMGNLSQAYVKNGDWSARVANQFIVSAGSVHPKTNKPYELISPAPIVPAPTWLIEWCISQKVEKKTDAKEELPRDAAGLIPHHYIHGWMLTQAGKLRAAGLTPDEIEPILLRKVLVECQPPIDEGKVGQMAKSMANYPEGRNTDLLLTQTQQAAIEAVIPIIDDDSRFDMKGATFDTKVYEEMAQRFTPYPNPGYGDLVSTLSNKLVQGTSIPLAYTREPLKAMVLHALDGKLAHSAFPKMSLRGNYFSLGESEGGKTTGLEFAMEAARLILANGTIHAENLFRYKSETTFIRSFTPEGTIKRLADGTIKSGRPGNPSQFLYIKEGNLVANCSDYFGAVFSQLTNLYDQTEAGTESMTNGDFSAGVVKASTVMCFTPTDFKATFGGKGTIGGGGFNRWPIVNPEPIHDYDDKDWERFDESVFQEISTRLAKRVFELSLGERIVLTEEPKAQKIRLEVKAMLKKAGKVGKRLLDYFMREQVVMAATAVDGRLVMTFEQAMYAKAWVEAQIDCRLTCWPSDSVNQIEAMEHAIRKAVFTHHVSETRLKDACHFYREGSGGWFVYSTALKNAVQSGAIKPTGKTRKNIKVYCPGSCSAHSAVKDEEPKKKK